MSIFPSESACAPKFLQIADESKHLSALQKNEDIAAIEDLITDTSNLQKGELAALVKKCLDVDESFLDRDHFHLTNPLKRLAHVCISLGMIKESESVIRKVVSIRKKFGDSFAGPLNKLAEWLICYRKYKKAERQIAEGMGPEMYLFRIAHARFHRTRIDEFKQEDGFEALDGFHHHLVTFNHFLGNDLVPAKDLLQHEIKNSDAEKRLSFIEKTLHESSIVSSDVNSLGCQELSSHFVEDVKSIRENECLLIEFSLPGHATFIEFKKEAGVLLAKLYNSGGGATLSHKEEGKFIVPEFKISQDSMYRVLNALRFVNSTLIQKLEEQGDEAWVDFDLCEHIKDAIVKNGGEENTTFYEAHLLQDRGNCTWKGFSTWVHKQCEDISVSITEFMIKRCREKYPYLEPSLSELFKEGKSVPLHRFMKMIAYEKVRAEISSLFSISLGKESTEQIQEKIKAKAPVYAKTACGLTKRRKKGALDEKKVELYISALASTIIQNDAVARYRKKESKRTKH